MKRFSIILILILLFLATVMPGTLHIKRMQQAKLQQPLNHQVTPASAYYPLKAKEPSASNQLSSTAPRAIRAA